MTVATPSDCVAVGAGGAFEIPTVRFSNALFSDVADVPVALVALTENL